jgi:hypothetical protein
MSKRCIVSGCNNWAVPDTRPDTLETVLVPARPCCTIHQQRQQRSMEGSLLIKKKLALGSTWSTHYCVLNPNTCVLTHTLKGTSKEVVVTGVDACNELLNRKGKKENRFNFVLANGRLLCASCPYPAKRFEWLAAVREACPQASNAQPAEQVAMMTWYYHHHCYEQKNPTFPLSRLSPLFQGGFHSLFQDD